MKLFTDWRIRRLILRQLELNATKEQCYRMHIIFNSAPELAAVTEKLRRLGHEVKA